MYSWIASIGGYVINGIGHLGNIFILLVQIVLRSALIFKRPRLLVEQILFIGV